MKTLFKMFYVSKEDKYSNKRMYVYCVFNFQCIKIQCCTKEKPNVQFQVQQFYYMGVSGYPSDFLKYILLQVIRQNQSFFGGLKIYKEEIYEIYFQSM